MVNNNSGNRRLIHFQKVLFSDTLIGSRKGIEIIRQMLDGKEVSQESSGMSKREWSELMAVIENTK